MISLMPSSREWDGLGPGFVARFWFSARKQSAIIGDDWLQFDIVYTVRLRCTISGMLYTPPVIVRVARLFPVHRDYVSLHQDLGSLHQDLGSSLILTPPELGNTVLQGR